MTDWSDAKFWETRRGINMVSERTLEVFKAYLGCQRGSLEDVAKKNKQMREQPFVTISRQAGAGSMAIAEELVQFLKQQDRETVCMWTLFNQSLVEKVLEEHDLPKTLAEFLSEEKKSELQSYFEELFGLHPSEWTLVHKTSQTILHLAQIGNVVLLGRGAGIVTRRLPYGFHVRLVGSLERRIQYTQDYRHLNREQASQLVQKEDQGRREYVKKYFNKNIDDPLLYNVTINTDFISHADAARLIGDAVLEIRHKIKISTK